MQGLDKWFHATQAVQALWNSSDRLNDVKTEYLLLTGGSQEAFDSRTRRGDVIPIRFGFAFLLNRGFGFTLSETGDNFVTFGDHSVVSYAVQNFANQAEQFNLTFPPSPDLSYSLRLVCRALNGRRWEDVLTDNLLETYCQDVGVDKSKVISKEIRPHMATVRNGFFYLVHRVIGFNQMDAVRDYGCVKHRSIISFGVPRIEEALKIWGERYGTQRENGAFSALG